MNNIKNVFRIFLKILLSFVGTALVLLCANSFQKEFSLISCIIYFLFFVGFPFLFFSLFIKAKSARIYLLVCLVVVILVTPYLYYRNTVIINNNINSYLSESNDYNNQATVFLPYKEEVVSNAIFYEHRRELDMQHEMTRISVQYTSDDFANAKSKIDEINQNSENLYTFYEKEQFKYSGILFDGFTFYDSGYYTFVVNCCDETQTISYMFFRDANLEYMSAELALKIYYGDSYISP